MVNNFILSKGETLTITHVNGGVSIKCSKRLQLSKRLHEGHY